LAHQCMLGHLRSRAFEHFKKRLEISFNKGETFVALVRVSTQSCMSEFDKGAAGGLNSNLQLSNLSLKILFVMVALRLEDKSDKIENVLFSSLMDGIVSVLGSQQSSVGISADPLASNTWEEVSPKDVLITPVQCKSLWRQFETETEYTVTQAISSQVCYFFRTIVLLFGCIEAISYYQRCNNVKERGHRMCC
ncbi:hypothetical protein IFM89_009526, partial [Coptis chinensis]